MLPKPTAAPVVAKINAQREDQRLAVVVVLCGLDMGFSKWLYSHYYITNNARRRVSRLRDVYRIGLCVLLRGQNEYGFLARAFLLFFNIRFVFFIDFFVFNIRL